MGFNPSRLEPNSRDLYNSLTIKHQSGTALTGKVNNAALQLMENVQARVSARVGKHFYQRGHSILEFISD